MAGRVPHWATVMTMPISDREVTNPHGNMWGMPRILIIDDEPGMRATVRKALISEGHEVDEAEDGPSGLARAISGSFDLVILDLGLPHLPGESVLEQLTAVQPDLPVIVLTAKDDIDDRVSALDKGAEDYLTKPFALAELMARVRVQMRTRPMVTSPDNPAVMTHRRVTLDRLRRCAEVNGEDVLLTPQEFSLAEQFIRHPEETLSRSELLRTVWGLEQAPRRSNLVDVGVAQLRRRLGQDTIETVRGEGYRFLG